MAENCRGEAPVAPKAGARPTITLPPRSSLESLFHCGGGGGGANASPGPLTLVSSFFANDPDPECRSFTQLLAGAMNSPVATARRTMAYPGEQEEQRRSEGASGGDAEAEKAGSRLVRLGQNRPPSLAVNQPQFLTVPPGFSPGGLLDSPAFFSPGLGNFAMSHQEALAQVTAQASHSPFRMFSQAEFPSPFPMTTTSSLAQRPNQEIPTLKADDTTPQSIEGSQSDQRSQPTAVIVDKPTDDGYNWRKYGQKMVKGSEYPRSYYKCTHPKCPVKKKVERSLDGQVTEIIYKGQHTHQPPPPNKRAKEGSSLPSGSNDINGNVENPAISEPGPMVHHRDFGKSDDMTSVPLISRRDQESAHGIPDQTSGSSDNEKVAEIRTDEGIDSEPDLKRRNLSASCQRTLTEPRIIVQTTSEVDLLDDGYKWRKYGQKVVKGNPNPRSYYKCTYSGCNVRKHIERSSTDHKAVITTYEGKHNHNVPALRNSSHNMASGVAALNSASTNHASFRPTNFRNSNQQPVAVLQLKEEHEIT